MRLVIQRVSKAQVEINNTIVGNIGKGFMVLIGIENEDTDEDIMWLCNKMLQMRIFSDENGLMNKSIQDVHGDILLVSQFTLYASTKKGNRPSFTKSSKPEFAIPLYEKFIQVTENLFNKNIQKGIFGADMQVTITNDGPVTIIIDSKNKE